MHVILHEGNRYILRFDKGEEVLTTLANFCSEHNVTAGYFTALGACASVTLAFYDIKTKTYEDKTFEEDMEIAGIIGNVALLDGKTMIHAHGSFSNRSFQMSAGHVKKLIASATCEVHLTVLYGVMKRGLDSETGLNLLKSD